MTDDLDRILRLSPELMPLNATGFGNFMLLNNTDPSAFHQGGRKAGISALGVVLVACFTVIVNAAFFIPAYVGRRRRRRLAAQTAAARRLADALQESDDELALAQTKATRYNNIESWVVSRQVLPHDHLCDKLKQAEIDCSTGSVRRNMYAKKRTSTVDTVRANDEEWGNGKDETTEESFSPSASASEQDLQEVLSECSESRPECPICFDSIVPGDIASWSLESSCKHVFHHQCIKQWLLKHEGCPFCRAIFMPIDDEAMRQSRHSTSSSAPMQQVNMLLSAHNERTRSCYYCMDHGIVYLPNQRPSSITQSEWDSLTERGQNRPCMETLKKLRGDQTEETEVKEADETPVTTETESSGTSSNEAIPDGENDDSVSLDVGFSAETETEEATENPIGVEEPIGEPEIDV